MSLVAVVAFIIVVFLITMILTSQSEKVDSETLSIKQLFTSSELNSDDPDQKYTFRKEEDYYITGEICIGNVYFGHSRITVSNVEENTLDFGTIMESKDKINALRKFLSVTHDVRRTKAHTNLLFSLIDQLETFEEDAVNAAVLVNKTMVNFTKKDSAYALFISYVE